ncbi:glycoside hydrolase superfamily [Mycena galopus ATCC 62051]|nr:glycoside hydrolase superfamily [Mycena galopus ATCC 62051]
MSKLSSSAFAALILSAVTAFAFDLTRSDNVVVYWGQNSYGAANPNDPANWQQTISHYCQDTCIDVIPIAFTDPCGEVNLGNICDDNGSSGTCASLAAGIEACQAAGKIVTLSLGGAGGTVGFASDTDAQNCANTLWNAFLGGTAGGHRPFGTAILDGVDLDIESGTDTGYAAFANEIRTLWASAPKRYYLSAAPQCPYPDAWVGPGTGTALGTVPFDFVNVQFYNNYCGVAHGSAFNFATWNTWAQSAPNPNVKIFIGAPASLTAANAGEYVSASTLGSIALSTLGSFGPDNFGGVMLWDASQAYANSGYDMAIKNILTGTNNCGATGGGVSGGGGGCAHTYIVASGDTCTHIEATTGVSDVQLHTLNPAINSGCTNLAIGQTLCLSGGCAQTYTVVSGDTCSAIEANTGVSDAQLHALNPAIDSGCTNLSIGQTLCLSGGGSGCTQTYTVVSGDTCSGIETSTGVSDATLHSLNPSINSGCSNLSIGQVLCV